VETASPPAVKMIELKLSQGAKPAHGGILPAAKVTPAIAEARGVPLGRDCLSPLRHSAFSGPRGLVLFIQRLRELSGGKPVGIKLCIGQPNEFCALVRAMLELDITPDFITVDGAEGGTGAAPPEFSNSVGAPMEEGLTLVHGVLRGAGLRDRVRVIAAGKILTGFGVVRTLALGADSCNAARAMVRRARACARLHCGSKRLTARRSLALAADVRARLHPGAEVQQQRVPHGRGYAEPGADRCAACAVLCVHASSVLTRRFACSWAGARGQSAARVPVRRWHCVWFCPTSYLMHRRARLLLQLSPRGAPAALRARTRLTQHPP
jgi:hypothetical protein